MNKQTTPRATSHSRQISRAVMSSRLVSWLLLRKQIVAVLIIFAIFFFLIYYLITHPAVIVSLLHTNPLVLVLLFFLYIAVIATQFGIIHATVRLCHKELPAKNGALLTVYSVLANFFGPLQSGPGVRAVYLKKKVGLRVRDYTVATFLYYFIYAAINCSALFSGSLPIIAVVGIATSTLVLFFVTRKMHLEPVAIFIVIIFLITFVQILLMMTIYFVEMNAVDPSAGYSFSQAILYGASANLSMFVSITPAGVGIREGFILFAQSLHHIPLTTIISAGVLDRAFYITFLGLLFVLSGIFHLKDMLLQKKSS